LIVVKNLGSVLNMRAMAHKSAVLMCSKRAGYAIVFFSSSLQTAVIVASQRLNPIIDRRHGIGKASAGAYGFYCDSAHYTIYFVINKYFEASSQNLLSRIYLINFQNQTGYGADSIKRISIVVRSRV
jgi:hypothetical protein